jgi:branched-chain amino acid transport system substrate-binding protein
LNVHSSIIQWARKAILAGIVGGAIAVPAQAADSIKIGVVNMLTGPLAEAGRFTVNGLTLAQEEINQAGGILGRKLELRIEDNASWRSRSSPTKAT